MMDRDLIKALQYTLRIYQYGYLFFHINNASQFLLNPSVNRSVLTHL